MASFAIEDADVEDKYTALAVWWERHCKAFSEWYLSLTTDQQKELIMKAVPDMPEKSYHEKLSLGLPIMPTDIILPEFSLDGMLSVNGRLFCLFMTRRLASSDQCSQEDLKIIKDLHSRRELPSFSHQALESMDTPFIDPMDPDESIRSLGPTSGTETRGAVQAYLESGRLVRAEIWMAMKIRRAAIVALLEDMAEEHYQAAIIKPSPTYKALLLGELQQQAAMVAMVEQQQQQQDSESVHDTHNNSKQPPILEDSSSGHLIQAADDIMTLEEVD